MWRRHARDIQEAVLIDRTTAFARFIDSCRVEAKAGPVAPTPLICGDGEKCCRPGVDVYTVRHAGVDK